MQSKNTLLAITAATTLTVLLCQQAAARRGDDDRRRSDDMCTTAPRSQWLPIDGFAAKAREQGYAVVKVEISGTCYEVYGTKDGIVYELYFNPATGDLVKIERERRD
jgi:hypothetical protein